MSDLGLTRVAFGCRTLDDIAAARDRFALTLPDGRVVGRVSSARRPREAARLIGGRLFWIIRHRLVARQEILDVAADADGRTEFRLALDLVPVVPVARRSHQGWRYLERAAWPADADAAVPVALMDELVRIGLD